MPQHAPKRGERDAGVAAGSFGNPHARAQFSRFVGAPQNVRRHAILDAAREIHVLALGVEGARLAAISKVDGKQRRVADRPGQRIELRTSRKQSSDALMVTQGAARAKCIAEAICQNDVEDHPCQQNSLWAPGGWYRPKCSRPPEA